MTEVSRNFQQNFGVTADQAAHRESEIREHFGEAWVEGYEDLSQSMTRKAGSNSQWRSGYAIRHSNHNVAESDLEGT
jgi:hypothetical protein